MSSSPMLHLCPIMGDLTPLVSCEYLAYRNCRNKFAAVLTNSLRGKEDAEALDNNLNTCFQTNVIGNIHLFNIFLSLIKSGQTKKIVTISTGMADIDVTVDLELVTGAAYSISKAAMNMAIAKFHAEFKPEGIIFMGVCPGIVNTGHHESGMFTVHSQKPLKPHLLMYSLPVSPGKMPRLGAMVQKFTEYAPNFKGPVEPKDAVRDVLKVIANATMEFNGGHVVSHFGNRQWL